MSERKVEIVGTLNRLIVAGTGYVGHHQRFVEAIRDANAKKEFDNKSEIETAKHLARVGVNDFASTIPAFNTANFQYSALVAYKANNKPCLCELVGSTGFQPEVKRIDDLWFTSMGSGQSITDPFLALFKTIFWTDGPPDVKGGIFTAYWALKHACDVNPGGINIPIKIAALGQHNGRLEPWMLSDDELSETQDLVQAATEHFTSFRDVLLGKIESTKPPTAPIQ
jgi:hypothetical protein